MQRGGLVGYNQLILDLMEASRVSLTAEITMSLLLVLDSAPGAQFKLVHLPAK